MAVGGVVGNEIQQHLQAGAMRLSEQHIEVRQRPEQRIDADVVGDVIAEIGHRRGKNRADPDRIDPKLDQVRQAGDDAAQIADAVRIRILERARIDFVNDGGVPPWHVRHALTFIIRRVSE